MGDDYSQSQKMNGVNFADSVGWKYEFANVDLDISVYGNVIYSYINEYVVYLKTIIKDDSLSGNVITLNELKDLGCILDDEDTTETATCGGSKYLKWLNNNQVWWTRTAFAWESGRIWYFSSNRALYDESPNYNSYGVRPTITLSKDALKTYYSK